ncbi:MAG: 30S ribosomal protein S16 [Candidatus Andersenbacteria bacterium RIFCSPHIGHO2_12_FULL_45_11b]|uniref:Small ribosomal subunit protein bS16 n=1 Tax=Candidatus Andersenbacteria bacterium RIFCSPHIGHO2_12_FULL_45_11b TaxID=1797282 RepID=A0A1G1XB97_9BACT|nr:MAG: 30S ribosomal protein S16 [Candidatus Andersenbacteria bacterium RIFCSPHIGHO2_12_FULL_45_11b]
MLRIRLQRRGKRGYATYRVVVADGHAPIKGRFIEDIGSYNPHTSTFSVDTEAVKNWMSKGVQPSDTVYNLLITNKIITGEKKALFTPKPKQAEPAPAK